jgi:hypothetical protein
MVGPRSSRVMPKREIAPFHAEMRREQSATPPLFSRSALTSQQSSPASNPSPFFFRLKGKKESPDRWAPIVSEESPMTTSCALLLFKDALGLVAAVRVMHVFLRSLPCLWLRLRLGAKERQHAGH